MMTTTRTPECTAVEVTAPGPLLLAFELGERAWKLGFTTGLGQRPRLRQVPAAALDRIVEEIARAKQRFHLPADAPVVSCYEAGREGFWLHRWLLAHDVTNHVIDSASIEVNRRARRAKTDRLDLIGLLNLLARHQLGDARVWRVIRVPSVVDEDARHLHRTWETLQQDRTRVINRLRSLLATHGIRLTIDRHFLDRLGSTRAWDGTPLPPGVQERLRTIWAQLELLNAQRTALATQRTARQRAPQTQTERYASQLPTLRGIGPIGAWTLATEIFGWRAIRNRRQLGALVGLVPAPYQSGDLAHDQGITRAGNKHVRRVMVQLAWGWVRFQPTSRLTCWFHERFGGSRRHRRIGIVALARKLLIALWRYVESGVVPDGARVRESVA